MRAIALAIGLLTLSVGAHAANIDWSIRSNPPASQALFAPDNVSESAAAVKYFFGGPSSNYASFQSTLGLTAAQMARADLVLFDLNGGGSPAGGIESTRIFLTDGVTFTTVDWDETLATIAPEAVAWGSLPAASYSALFGIAPGADPFIGFLVLDVPSAISVRASLFEVDLLVGAVAGLPGEGTPNFDALGRIADVPEPGTIALLGLSLAGILGCRRARLPPN